MSDESHQSNKPNIEGHQPNIESEREIALLSTLVDSAQQNLYKQDFNSLMRNLEAALPHLPKFGLARQAQDDPVRIGQMPSLAFPSSTVGSVSLGSDGERAKIVIEQAFLGLLGANGPMPNHISEYVDERSRHNQDHTIRSFIDLFHHRILTLFYRIWAESEPVTHLDRPDQGRFTGYLSALVGEEQQGPLNSMPRALAGRYSEMAPTAEGVAAVVTHYLSLPVAVEEFEGDWLAVEGDNQYCLDGRSQLGGASFLGDKVYSCASTFKVVIGPLERQEDLDALRPDGGLRAALNKLIKEYVGFEFTWHIELLVEPVLLTDVELSAGLGGAQLGWNSLLTDSLSDEHFQQQYQTIRL